MKTARLINPCLSATLLLIISGFFASGVKAQQLDKPDLIQSFPTGDGPQFLAFDGANIWTSDYYGGTLTKLRASDGAVQGTFAVGRYPGFLTYDGANIWVSVFGNNTVIKLRASDGVLLGTFPMPSEPEGLAWDGENMWVALWYEKAVAKLRGSDGAVLGIYPSGATPFALLFDGENIWVGNAGKGGVTKLRASEGGHPGIEGSRRECQWSRFRRRQNLGGRWRHRQRRRVTGERPEGGGRLSRRELSL